MRKSLLISGSVLLGIGWLFTGATGVAQVFWGVSGNHQLADRGSPEGGDTKEFSERTHVADAQ